MSAPIRRGGVPPPQRASGRTPVFRRAMGARDARPPAAMARARRFAYSRAMTQPHRPVGPGDHVFLVDGSSFVFRAYFQSIRQDQKYNYRSDRLPIGAVRLFATKVLQFVKDGAAGIKPTHLAIIFDKSENSFRRELYPAYKSHRPEPPADLVPQFPLMRRRSALSAWFRSNRTATRRTT